MRPIDRANEGGRLCKNCVRWAQKSQATLFEFCFAAAEPLRLKRAHMLSTPRLTCAVVLVALAVSQVRGQQNTNLKSDLDRISATVLSGDSMELLRHLTDDIGARVVASHAYERAAQWATARFREAGLTNIRFEEFTLPNVATWARASANHCASRAHAENRISRLGTIDSAGRNPRRRYSDFRPFWSDASIAISATEEWTRPLLR